MAEFPHPNPIALTHFIVADDIERSRRFYTEVLGGELVRSGEPTYVALANSWIIINEGVGPTDDKPTVILETPPDPDRVSSFLNPGRGHPERVLGVERAGRRVPDAADPARDRDPLLHPRSGWPPHRGRPDDPAAR
jgi:catechol 2,3-dioxygenase-like lactoylglutathione lyase family enzyme